MKKISLYGNNYILNTGQEASTRLDLLEKVYGIGSHNFFKRIGIQKGMKVAALGCGIGNMEVWLAQQVGTEGKVIAIDISEEQLEIAREKEKQAHIQNIEFVQADIYELGLQSDFDLVCARFLLIHLNKPKLAIQKMISFLKKGGCIALEDITAQTFFSYPESVFFKKGLELMFSFAEKNGQDHNIGQKLFTILNEEKISDINIYSYQPIFSKGEEKSYFSRSVEEASSKLIEQDIVTTAELKKLLNGMNDFIKKPETIVGMPSTYQVSGTKL